MIFTVNLILLHVSGLSHPLYNCSSWFHDSFEDNLNIIRNYPRGNADEYLWKIGGDRTNPNATLTSFPVIATAANSAFYGVTQGLLKSIHEILVPKYGEIKIIYYDLGLQEDQYNQVIIMIIMSLVLEDYILSTNMILSNIWSSVK